jgi:hypothetical protein
MIHVVIAKIEFAGHWYFRPNISLNDFFISTLPIRSTPIEAKLGLLDGADSPKAKLCAISGNADGILLQKVE